MQILGRVYARKTGAVQTEVSKKQDDNGSMEKSKINVTKSSSFGCSLWTNH